MYAVIESGGKQYRVREGDVVRVERLDQEVGSTLDIDAVHLLSEGSEVQIGRPLVDGARVRTTVVEQGRSSKVIAFKKKRRKGYRRTKGHRQPFTALRVDEIVAPGKAAAGKGKKKAAAKKTAGKGKKKAAAKKTAGKGKKKAAAKKTAAKGKKKAAAKKTAGKGKKKAAAKKTAAKGKKKAKASARAGRGSAKSKKKPKKSESKSKSKDE